MADLNKLYQVIVTGRPDLLELSDLIVNGAA
jgi:hypothetical protein